MRIAVSQKTWKVMLELRLRWSDTAFQEEAADSDGGLWIPDTPAARAKLSQAVELGNKLYGHETHWIEERQA